MDLRQQMNIVAACNCRITQLYGEWAKQCGWSYHTMITLYALNMGRPCTQKQIAEEWLIPKQTVNTVIKDLERRGLVRFEAGRDQKEKPVSFTEAGRTYAEKKLEALYQMEERVMDHMGPEVCRALVESSRAFAQALAKEVDHGA